MGLCSSRAAHPGTTIRGQAKYRNARAPHAKSPRAAAAPTLLPAPAEPASAMSPPPSTGRAGDLKREEEDDDDVSSDGEVFLDAFSSVHEMRSPAFMNPTLPWKISLAESNQAVASRSASQFKNTYSEPDPGTFLVRGKRYLDEGRGGSNQKHLKQPAVDPPYAIEGLSMIRSPKRLECVARQLPQLAKFFAEFPADENPCLPTFLIFNWIVSSLGASECVFVNHVFRLKSAKEASQDGAMMAAMRRFLSGTDDDKRRHFKFLFKVIDAPSTLKRIISFCGGERPVLIGKQLTTNFVRGSNFLEVNCDVSSSKIASMMTSSVLNQVGTLVHEHCWLLEGQRNEELPERILCLLRWNWNHASDVIVDVNEKGEVVKKE